MNSAGALIRIGADMFMAGLSGGYYRGAELPNRADVDDLLARSS
jgi:hypothetical protein